MKHLRTTVLAIILGLVSALPLTAQPLDEAQPTQVLVLGSYHFANPGLDVIKTQVVDVLLPAKQAEIETVVEALARFRPTKIAVEAYPASAPRLDSLYEAYRSGRYKLSRSESQQLGFRLADKFQHQRLYSINHMEDFPFDTMMNYAEVHDTAFVAFVADEMARITEEANRRQAQESVGEILRQINDPKNLEADHGIYMRFARVGAGDTFVGAELVAKWYERNLKIFANLQQIAEPGDRILVIYGGGHAPTLREFVTYDPEMVLVETLDYLPSF